MTSGIHWTYGIFDRGSHMTFRLYPWLCMAGAAAIACVVLGASRFLAALVHRWALPRGRRIPRGLVPIFWPKENPYSPAKTETDWLLYFDKRLGGWHRLLRLAATTKHAFTDGGILEGDSRTTRRRSAHRHQPCVQPRTVLGRPGQDTGRTG